MRRVILVFNVGLILQFLKVEATGNGDVRLRDGYSYGRSGRVEIYYNGVWGTVCDDDWDLTDASVVCRQLGFRTAENAYRNAFYSVGTGPIFLDNVQCSGYEERLDECHHRGWRIEDCTHREDAGVRCSVGSFLTSPPHWIAGSVRLQNGSLPNQGRVEVYWNWEWNTVCDDSWDLDDAIVVCRQLGYSSAEEAVGNAYFGKGAGDIQLDEVNCIGYESTLMQCSSSEIYQHNCGHWEDAGVICTTDIRYYKDGNVRLRGSSLQNEGRVEIYHSGSWGTVCGNGWDITDADVICNQLGYPDGAHSAYDLAYFGEGENFILLDYVSCDGSEHYLADCRHNGWYNHKCSHSEDAGVQCHLPEHLYPRLVNGTTWHEGRVEVWNVDHWEGVCSYKFYEKEASAVCKQLGFVNVETVYFWEKFGDDFDVASSIYFVCDHHETALSSCGQFRRWSTYCKATAIKCQASLNKSLSEVTIVGTVLAVLTFTAICTASCVAVFWKMYQIHRRSSPSVGFTNGSENFAAPQPTSSRPQILTDGTEPNINESPPPTYNDVVSNPMHHLPTNTNASITPHPDGEAAAMPCNFNATSRFPMQPNPAVTNTNPRTLVQEPLTNVSPKASQPNPKQKYPLSQSKNQT